MQARASGLRERLAGLREAAGREAAHLAALTRQRDEAAQDLRAGRAQRRRAGARRCRAAEQRGCAADERAPGGRARPCAASARPTNGLRRHWRRRRRRVRAQCRPRGRGGGPARGRARAAGRAAAAVDAMRPGELAALPAVDQHRDQAQQAERAVGGARAGIGGVESGLATLSCELTRAAAGARGQPRRAAIARRARACGARRVQPRRGRAALARDARRARTLARASRGAGARPRPGRPSARRRMRGAARRCADAAADADPAARQRRWRRRKLELAAADARAGHGARGAGGGGAAARGEAAAGQRDLRRSADALEAEIRVLESLAPAAEAGGLLDRLEVPEELATALAAALGDDLLAGTEPEAPALLAAARRPSWRRRGCPRARRRCSSLVGAPAVLEPRLRRIGLVEADEAAAAPAAARSRAPPGQPRRRAVALGRVRPGARRRGPLPSHGCAISCACTPPARSWRRSAQASPRGERRRRRVRAGGAGAREQRWREAEARWRAADTAQLRARQRAGRGRGPGRAQGRRAGAARRGGRCAGARVAELERERLELVGRGRRRATKRRALQPAKPRPATALARGRAEARDCRRPRRSGPRLRALATRSATCGAHRGGARAGDRGAASRRGSSPARRPAQRSSRRPSGGRATVRSSASWPSWQRLWRRPSRRRRPPARGPGSARPSGRRPRPRSVRPRRRGSRRPKR